MFYRNFSLCSLIFILAVFSSQAFAYYASEAFMSASSDEVEAKVKSSLQNRAETLNESFIELRHKAPEMSESELQEKAESYVLDIFDLRRMAARIMGPAARQVDRSIRDEFYDNLKETVFDHYFNVFLEYDGQSSIMINAITLNRNNDKRASASALLSDGQGGSYDVNLSLYWCDDRVQWMVENLIIEGVNIGLSLRTSFREVLSDNDNDIDKAIEQWGVQDADLETME